MHGICTSKYVLMCNYVKNYLVYKKKGEEKTSLPKRVSTGSVLAVVRKED